MLAVVDYQKHVAVRQPSRQPLERVAARDPRYLERTDHGARHQARVRQAGQVDEEHAIRPRAFGSATDLDGEAGLPTAPRADHGNQAVLRQPAVEQFDC